ncbi:MAG TPA: hypothetical protein VN025_16245 [Candidatus Dormibacteraeota bacterium]|jgi:hypothetical protein|nr:hypothetical protein [Candidatus Dormibacteraeota bacterium]
MKLSSIFLIALAIVLLCLPATVSAQNWAGILKPTSGAGACTLAVTGVAGGCAIDWSQTGIPGGIPSGSWTQSGSTITSTGSDQTSQIQTALNACGTNHYVLLAAGTFLINTNVTVPSNCELRGSGANRTILNVHGSSTAPVSLGSNAYNIPDLGSAKNITAGATAGSTSITLSSASGVTTGSYLVITENNNPAWVTNTGSEGTCTWCDGWTDGSKARGQIVEVTSVAGNVVTISPGLYTAYTLSPIAVPFTAMAKFAGARNLQVFSNNTGYTNSFFMDRCAYCWFVGVESNYTDGNMLEMSWSYRSEVRDSYFSNAFRHGSGVDSDIFIDFKTSASRIMNNIIERGHNSIMLNWGAAGNVVAYNYTHGGYDAGGTNWTFDGILMHGAHPQFNLIEGNVSPKYNPDNIWGSSSHNTNFRNWFFGTTTVCDPIGTTRATVTCSSPVNSFQIAYAEAINALSLHDNFVGDVTGSAKQQADLAYGSGVMSHLPFKTWPTSLAFDQNTLNFGFGYDAHADDGTTAGDNTSPYLTSTIYNSYSFSNTSTNCLSGGLPGICTTALPASFFLSGKPSWWASAVPYPAIGPDVTGGTGPGGHASLTASNSAQYCYLVTMGGKEGGAGSPLAFNADACYPSSISSNPPPTPSSGLNAIVNTVP